MDIIVGIGGMVVLFVLIMFLVKADERYIKKHKNYPPKLKRVYDDKKEGEPYDIG